ncbi:MAG: DUF5625 family protein [Campylobacteraceae bacterium]|jgi:hypothetical protein|nr:DUF5625 family protein [Campylobacteraceae bacterium]
MATRIDIANHRYTPARIIQMRIKTYIIIALTAMLYSGCAILSPDKIPTIPYGMKIDLSKSGNVYETTVKVKEKAQYYFFLGFAVDESNKTDKDQMFDFLRGARSFYNNTTIPIKLTIRKADDNELIIEKIYQTNGLYSHGSSYIKRDIKSFSLKKGIYNIRLETLKDIPFLEGREFFFSITNPKR